MKTISPALKFFLNLTMTQAVTAMTFDATLSLHSITLSDFMMLFHLSGAHEQKLRRIDLAEKVGLSASAVTRKLLPLEKIGIVQRELHERDARVSYVKLTDTGHRILFEAMESAEMAASDFYLGDDKKLDTATSVLIGLGGSIK